MEESKKKISFVNGLQLRMILLLTVCGGWGIQSADFWRLMDSLLTLRASMDQSRLHLKAVGGAEMVVTGGFELVLKKQWLTELVCVTFIQLI